MKNIEHLPLPVPPLSTTLLHFPPPSTILRVFPPRIARERRARGPGGPPANAQVSGVRAPRGGAGGAPVGRIGGPGGAKWGEMWGIGSIRAAPTSGSGRGCFRDALPLGFGTPGRAHEEGKGRTGELRALEEPTSRRWPGWSDECAPTSSGSSRASPTW